MHRTTPQSTTTPEIPTMQSIQAHSEISVDLHQSELEPLITRILLLSIQLQRKDYIIDQLQTQAQFHTTMRKSQIQTTNRELLVRYDRIEQQNRTLIETNVMLKNSIIGLERNVAELEGAKERAKFNAQLEEKVYLLEIKIKKAEEERIQYLEREKNLKRENSMLSYSAIKTSEKNKIRDLEYELSQMQAKLDSEKRLTADLKYQVEKDCLEIKSLKESQHILKLSYQEKIQKIELVKVTQDLRKSQCTAASEQKIALLSQQLNRLRQQLQIQRQTSKNLTLQLQQKSGQIRRLLSQLSTIQNSLQSQKQSSFQLQQSFTTKQQTFLKQIQSLEQSIKTYKANQIDIDLYIKQKQKQEWKIGMELERVRAELADVERVRDQYAGELRKVRKRGVGDCEICRVRGGSGKSLGVGSGKSLGGRGCLNLDDIIRETQKLNLSNKKIQTLLNHHEISTQHSQQTILHISE